MQQALVFPTWFLLTLLKPFLPQNHPFKHIHFSLKRWAICATELTKGLSMALWISCVVWVAGVVNVVIW